MILSEDGLSLFLKVIIYFNISLIYGYYFDIEFKIFQIKVYY